MKEQEKSPERKSSILAGLQWPEEGNPAFICFVTERKQKQTESLDPQIEYLTIIKEIECQTISELVDMIREEELHIVYAPSDKKYTTFIRDFNSWRRENKPNIQFRSAVNSSFESGILRIKDFIKKDKLRFPEDSIVKEQLKIFSKLSFKNKTDFYAVEALSHVISAIKKRTQTSAEIEPEQSAWY